MATVFVDATVELFYVLYYCGKASCRRICLGEISTLAAQARRVQTFRQPVNSSEDDHWTVACVATVDITLLHCSEALDHRLMHGVV